MKLQFSEQILEKYSHVKFHENPSSGSQLVPHGRTDRHEEANSRRSQFCKHVYKPTWIMCKTQFVPRSKHSVSVTKSNLLRYTHEYFSDIYTCATHPTEQHNSFSTNHKFITNEASAQVGTAAAVRVFERRTAGQMSACIRLRHAGCVVRKGNEKPALMLQVPSHLFLGK
jgi:hypothetical protein